MTFALTDSQWIVVFAVPGFVAVLCLLAVIKWLNDWSDLD